MKGDIMSRTLKCIAIDRWPYWLLSNFAGVKVEWN